MKKEIIELMQRENLLQEEWDDLVRSKEEERKQKEEERKQKEEERKQKEEERKLKEEERNQKEEERKQKEEALRLLRLSVLSLLELGLSMELIADKLNLSVSQVEKFICM